MFLKSCLIWYGDFEIRSRSPEKNIVISNAERNLENLVTAVKISPFGRDDMNHFGCYPAAH